MLEINFSYPRPKLALGLSLSLRGTGPRNASARLGISLNLGVLNNCHVGPICLVPWIIPPRFQELWSRIPMGGPASLAKRVSAV
jgi:hypothetical protein